MSDDARTNAAIIRRLNVRTNWWIAGVAASVCIGIVSLNETIMLQRSTIEELEAAQDACEADIDIAAAGCQVMLGHCP